MIVTAVQDVGEEPPADLVAAVKAAHRGGARIVSLCTGVFVLAAAGILDGRPATTHWLHASELARRYPAVKLNPGVLYVDDGDVLTSAGTTAGIDLCLHIVRRDLGAAVANRLARRLVAPAHRSGGQAQYIETPAAWRAETTLAPLLDWMRRAPARAPDRHGPRQAREPDQPDADPAIPRHHRQHPGQMANRSAHPARPRAARDRAPCRSTRSPGRPASAGRRTSAGTSQWPSASTRAPTVALSMPAPHFEAKNRQPADEGAQAPPISPAEPRQPPRCLRDTRPARSRRQPRRTVTARAPAKPSGGNVARLGADDRATDSNAPGQCAFDTLPASGHLSCRRAHKNPDHAVDRG